MLFRGLVGAGGTLGNVVVQSDFVTTTHLISKSGTNSFTENIGDGDPTRYIVVAGSGYGGDLASIKINNTECLTVDNYYLNNGTSYFSSIGVLLVPTGTTADFSITSPASAIFNIFSITGRIATSLNLESRNSVAISGSTLDLSLTTTNPPENIAAFTAMIGYAGANVPASVSAGMTRIAGTYGGFIVNAAYSTDSQNISNPINIIWSSGNWRLPAVGSSLAIGF